MHRHGLAFFVPLAAVAVVCSAHADVPTQNATPERQVQSAVEGTLRAIRGDAAARDGDLARLTTLVQQQFLPFTDFSRTTRLAVGSAWRNASPEQQRQLNEQFTALLVRSYALSLSQLREQNVSFRFQPAQAGANAADAVVPSRVMTAGDDMQIDYRLQRTPTGWKIYDINMMGAWLIEVYRKQFADIVARGGVDGLVRYLTEHNARQAAQG
jgi:ABC-type transporter MlaC component